MQLKTDVSGNPVSALIHALNDRRLDIVRGDGAHPLQILNSRWAAFAVSFSDLVDKLERMSAASSGADGAAAIDAFRRVVYDATELFDVYAQLLPDRLEPPSRIVKEHQDGYRANAKRLRELWAYMCNSCKHSAAKFSFTSVECPERGQRSDRFVFVQYRNGDSLLRDEKVHKHDHGICLVNAAKRLVHDLLRTDIIAARLVDAYPDQDCDPIPIIPGALPIGSILTRLDRLKSLSIYEQTAFDSYALKQGALRLQPEKSSRMSGQIHVTFYHSGDGVTRTFAIR